jgi:RNA polymerase-binding transcription factor DksA
MLHPSHPVARRMRRGPQPRVSGPATPRARVARGTDGGGTHGSHAQALRRLEREHVALLLAISELESSTAGSHDLQAALLRLLKADLARAQYALSRASAGQYGVCDRCGRALPTRLLEVNPATTRCHACVRASHSDHSVD